MMVNGHSLLVILHAAAGATNLAADTTTDAIEKAMLIDAGITLESVIARVHARQTVRAHEQRAQGSVDGC